MPAPGRPSSGCRGAAGRPRGARRRPGAGWRRRRSRLARSRRPGRVARRRSLSPSPGGWPPAAPGSIALPPLPGPDFELLLRPHRTRKHRDAPGASRQTRGPPDARKTRSRARNRKFRAPGARFLALEGSRCRALANSAPRPQHAPNLRPRCLHFRRAAGGFRQTFALAPACPPAFQGRSTGPRFRVEVPGRDPGDGTGPTASPCSRQPCTWRRSGSMFRAGGHVGPSPAGPAAGIDVAARRATSRAPRSPARAVPPGRTPSPAVPRGRSRFVA